MPSPQHVTTPAGDPSREPAAEPATACLVLGDGSAFFGQGFGATGQATAELVFHTAMAGFQELISDPASTGRILAFTFPHLGATGATPEDDQSAQGGPAGIVTRELPGPASNWRAQGDFAPWLVARGCIGIAGIDTRRLTRLIRQQGAQAAVIAHDPAGRFDIEAMAAQARDWTGTDDLAAHADTDAPQAWEQGSWRWQDGFAKVTPAADAPRVVAIDLGAARDDLRALADTGAAVTVVPATTSAAGIAALQPDGIFLTGGPGDPAARAPQLLPVLHEVLAQGLPVFGIGLGHQVLALALGAQVRRLAQGHHGANHPLRDTRTGRVEIVAMNNGFAVDAATLPEGLRETHVSLFDGSNGGIEAEGRPLFSMQNHPGPGPGPCDAPQLMARFAQMMQARRAAD